MHPKVVQESLGHSSVTLTLDTYSHVVPSLHVEVADRMQGLLRQMASTWQRNRPSWLERINRREPPDGSV